MVMYGNEFGTKKKKFKPRIKLNHNIYNGMFVSRSLSFLNSGKT